MHRSLRMLMLSGCVVSAFWAKAQDADTLSHTLRGVQVKGRMVRSYLNETAGKSVISMKMMEQMPRILGNADPMHYAQLLPGVQTNSEYDAGLHIQGCDNSHNQVGIDGVPIYNVAHMLGFFSVFNATHFSQMQFAKSPKSASAPNRLGGQVDMTHNDSVATQVCGDLSVGPMSSQGTLRIPTGRNSTLTVSARAAYLNLLYSQWLKIDEEEIRYSFCDYNLTWLYRPDSRNTLWADFYYGNDDVGYNDGTYDMETSLRWSNMMGAVHWRHTAELFSTEHCLYYTTYSNRFLLDQTNFAVRLPSRISDIGYKASLTAGRIAAGAEVAYHNIHPQDPHVDGLLQRTESGVERQHTVEASLYADYSLPVGRNVTLTGGLRGNIYAGEGSTYFSADPGASLSWRPSAYSELSLYAGIKHQYLFRTGFSDAGLPTEFWFSSGAGHPPQYSYNTSVSFSTFLFGKAWRISAEAYYKRLFHQVEYSGNVLDFVYTDYDIDDVLLSGNGYNYGLNLMVEKRKGRVTGWMSYSVGRAMRRYPGSSHTGRYPASHERIHEFNLVATCRLSQRWSLGTTFVAASGTPYTKAEKFYIVNSNVITEFGPHNGERTDPYMRLDLSVNYDFRPRGRYKSGINLSLYNVTMHTNNLFYRLKIYKGEFGNRPFSFVIDILPSINYYCSF